MSCRVGDSIGMMECTKLAYNHRIAYRDGIYLPVVCLACYTVQLKVQDRPCKIYELDCKIGVLSNSTAAAIFLKTTAT